MDDRRDEMGWDGMDGISKVSFNFLILRYIQPWVSMCIYDIYTKSVYIECIYTLYT